MSSTIWTQCGGAERIDRLDATAHRVVEAQHVIATRHLVSSDERQALLEAMIEGVKPPKPEEAQVDQIDYLLYTPFRYRPPLRSGTRFGSAHERAVWYGADAVHTALAEVAFHLIRFLNASDAADTPTQIDWTSFQIGIDTARGVDLARAPFDNHRDTISHPTEYTVSQALGAAMREAGVEAFRFHSARDPAGGTALGVFTPRAFETPRVDRTRMITWRGTASRRGVLLIRKNALSVDTPLRFAREQFEIDGDLADPEG